MHWKVSRFGQRKFTVKGWSLLVVCLFKGWIASNQDIHLTTKLTKMTYDIDIILSPVVTNINQTTRKVPKINHRLETIFCPTRNLFLLMSWSRGFSQWMSSNNSQPDFVIMLAKITFSLWPAEDGVFRQWITNDQNRSYLNCLTFIVNTWLCLSAASVNSTQCLHDHSVAELCHQVSLSTVICIWAYHSRRS